MRYLLPVLLLLTACPAPAPDVGADPDPTPEPTPEPTPDVGNVDDLACRSRFTLPYCDPALADEPECSLTLVNETGVNLQSIKLRSRCRFDDGSALPSGWELNWPAPSSDLAAGASETETVPAGGLNLQARYSTPNGAAVDYRVPEFHCVDAEPIELVLTDADIAEGALQIVNTLSWDDEPTPQITSVVALVGGETEWSDNLLEVPLASQESLILPLPSEATTYWWERDDEAAFVEAPEADNSGNVCVTGTSWFNAPACMVTFVNETGESIGQIYTDDIHRETDLFWFAMPSGGVADQEQWTAPMPDAHDVACARGSSEDYWLPNVVCEDGAPLTVVIGPQHVGSCAW